MRAVLVLVVAIGCSSTTNVGERCGQNRPVCDESLSCSSSVPGGYCTTACSSPGSTAQCPDGSVCDDAPLLGLSCLRICDDLGDCGRDDVTCSAVTDSNLKACKPK
ncbi:MAG TPA: hypothetical protein VFV99_30830 [Kofleriaceae bacterium]|nr:hypothetical protein [Kofleriaceae bacterium]